MNEIAMARALVDGLAERLGLEGLLADDEDVAMLEFEEGPAIQLALDEEGGISLTAHLGDAPEGDVELAEELLASNLNWRDTEGATLAMERFSRGVFLARRWTVAEIVDVQGLCTALEQFMLLAERWIQVFPQLGSSGHAGDAAPLPPGDFIGVRG
jgi:hypothetical protein